MTEITELDSKQIREVVDGIQPMAWMKDDRVVCVSNDPLLIRTFCEVHGIPITSRFDAWGMLCEPYLDTELSKEDDERIFVALGKNGFEAAEVRQIRNKISSGLSMATFLSWEWQYYGLDDVRRHCTGIFRLMRDGGKEFERWTSEITSRPWKQELASGQPRKLVPEYTPPRYGLKARMQYFPDLLEPNPRRSFHEDFSRRYQAEEAIVATATRSLSDPLRHYHNIRHLEEALRLGGASHRAQRKIEYGEWRKSKDYRSLWWAILFHDAIYVPGRSDNEELSARLAGDTMRQHGLSEKDRKQLVDLIMLTRHHSPAEAKSRELKAMHDGDLGIFGLWPARYAQYCEDVRKEWIGAGVVDASMFNKGRLDFLEKVLEQHRGRPFYFALNPLFSKLAEENISREIDELRRLVA